MTAESNQTPIESELLKCIGLVLGILAGPPLLLWLCLKIVDAIFPEFNLYPP